MIKYLSYFPSILLWSTLIFIFACGTSEEAPPEETEIVSTTTVGGDSTARIINFDIEHTRLLERHYLIFRQQLSLQDMNGFFAIEGKALEEAVAKAGITPAGPATALFYEWDTEKGWGDAAVALPVEKGTKLPPYVTITLPATDALSSILTGGYDKLSALHFALSSEINQKGLTAIAPSIEEYPVGPLNSKNPESFVTHIYYPYTNVE